MSFFAAVKSFVKETLPSTRNGLLQRRCGIGNWTNLCRFSRADCIYDPLEEPTVVRFGRKRIGISQHAILSLLFTAIDAMEQRRRTNQHSVFNGVLARLRDNDQIHVEGSKGLFAEVGHETRSLAFMR